MQSRRTEERVVPCEAEPIEVQIMGNGFLEIVDARDIGPSGIGIYVPHSFRDSDIDTEVDLILTLPRSQSFKARGIIRHSGIITTGMPRSEADDKSVFGISFTLIDPHHQRHILAYIQTRLSDRRRSPRLSPDPANPVCMELRSDEPARRQVAVRDISSGGICAHAEDQARALRLGEGIEFLLSFPPKPGKTMFSGTFLRFDGDRSEMGIQFGSLSAFQRDLLQEYLSCRLRNPGNR